MIVSFTQTYGAKRNMLHDIHMKDTRLLQFKELLDVNIYSFHNVPVEIRESFLKRLPVSRVKYLIHETTYYSTTMIRLKEELKRLGATHIFFSQDDTFSVDNKHIDWRELLEYVRCHKEKFFLNLNHCPDDFVDELEPDMQFETFGIHHLTTKYWTEHDLWAMTDEPCICSIDMFDKIYNEERLSKKDVWSMEIFINKVWKKEERDTPKFITDRSLFQNYNIWGLCTADQVYYYEMLEERGFVEQINTEGDISGRLMSMQK